MILGVNFTTPFQDLAGNNLASQFNHVDQVDAKLVVEVFTERKQLDARADCEAVVTVHDLVQVPYLTPAHHGCNLALAKAVL